MNFKTEGQELPTTNYVNKYINALTIVEANVITEATKSAIKGTPALKLSFITDPVEGLTDESGNPTGQTADHYFYITDATFEGKTIGGRFYPGVRENLMMIADALGVREQFDNIGNTATTTDEYLQGVASVLKGKARFKFGGEEVAGKDGKPNWNKAVLAKYGFVESVTVPTEASKLKISPKDLKSLPTTDETVTNSNVDATSLY
jgi:hypothetical protein